MGICDYRLWADDEAQLRKHKHLHYSFLALGRLLVTKIDKREQKPTLGRVVKISTTG